MWESFVEWVMSLPPDRVVGLITTAGVAGYTAWLTLWYAAKGTWHAGAFVRRRLASAPLDSRVAGIITAIESGAVVV